MTECMHLVEDISEGGRRRFKEDLEAIKYLAKDISMLA